MTLTRGEARCNGKAGVGWGGGGGREWSPLQCGEVSAAHVCDAGIHCFRVHDAAEQLAVVRKLPSFLLQRPKVRRRPTPGLKLPVVDLPLTPTLALARTPTLSVPR